jgi:hypothetical protein
MIVVNFLRNNCYNLSTAEPDYIKLFLFINSVDNIFVRFDPTDPTKIFDHILQMKYKP